MMAAQEIIELFCELITVRLPIIEAQRFVSELNYDHFFFVLVTGTFWQEAEGFACMLWIMINKSGDHQNRKFVISINV